VIPLEELLAALNLEDASLEDEVLLERYEAAAVAHLQRSTRRYFGPPRLVTEHLRVRRGRLRLSEQPIGDVAITERWRPGDDGVLVADTHLRLPYVLRESGQWSLGAEYEAVYWTGYGSTTVETEDGPLTVKGPPVPDDIWRAALELVRSAWQGRTMNEGMKSETISGYSYTRADGASTNAVPAFVQGVINNWKRELVS